MRLLLGIMLLAAQAFTCDVAFGADAASVATPSPTPTVAPADSAPSASSPTSSGGKESAAASSNAAEASPSWFMLSRGVRLSSALALAASGSVFVRAFQPGNSCWGLFQMSNLAGPYGRAELGLFGAKADFGIALVLASGCGNERAAITGLGVNVAAMHRWYSFSGKVRGSEDFVGVGIDVFFFQFAHYRATKSSDSLSEFAVAFGF